MSHQTENLITHIFKNHSAEQIIESVFEPDSTVYYVYAANHMPYSGNTIPEPTNSQADLIANTYSNMIFGKRVTAADVKLMIRRIDWTSNTVYDMYDHNDSTLFDKDFYVLVDEGAFYHVYKCLYNNNGEESLIQPVFAHSTQESDLFDTNDGYYKTSDGYQWKYMYSIDEATFNKFATDNYIPVTANTVVVDAAVDGAIDVIKVDAGGSRYDNYFNSSFTGDDLRVTSNAASLISYSSDVLYALDNNINIANASGSVATLTGTANVTGTSTAFATDFQINDYIKVANSTAYEIKKIVSITNNTLLTISGNFTNTFSSANVSLAYPFNANPANDFYNGCTLLITAGAGIGQYKRIIDYVNDGTKLIAVLEEGFTINPDTTSHYSVSPTVEITGNGTETVTCEARALVNSAAANTIYEVEILQRGEFYRAATANVLVSNVITIANTASFTPIISPFKGHGSDAANELGSVALEFSVEFSNTQANSISVANDYRTVGIMKDPLWANVEFEVERLSDASPGADGSFVEGEEVCQIDRLKLAGNVSVNTTSANVIGTGTEFTGLSVDDMIVINAGQNWFITTITAVTNTTQITVASNVSFVNSAASIYKASERSCGYVLNFSPPSLFLANVESKFTQGGHIIGMSSYAVANVTNILSNEIEKNDGFSTFSQLNSLLGNLSGEFVEDETIWQGANLSSATFTAKYHSVNDGNTVIYYTQAMGTVANGEIVHGETSLATFTVLAKYEADIISGSGVPLYVQNGTNVTRAEDQTENIKIIVEF